MLLTPTQLEKIKAIIARRHAAMVLRIVGADALTAQERAVLREAGIDPDTATSEEVIRQAYLYGHIRAAMSAVSVQAGKGPRGAAAAWTPEQLEAHVEKTPIALTEREERAAQWAAVNAAQHIRGLGMRVDLDTGQSVLGVDRELAEEQRAGVSSAVEEAIRKRKSIRELRSDLGWQARDWSRDMDRIAVTELQNAHLEGQADEYRTTGEDPWVFKQPRPDACASCKTHYLGPDGMPRLFHLSELTGMGNNVGRKKAEWTPTLHALHPHCRCFLVRMPDGWGFNEDGDMIPGGKLGIRYGSEEDLQKSLAAEKVLAEVKAGDKVEIADGLTFRVEVPAGGTRAWAGGETVMLHPYGYLEGTLGADGDEYDAYLGPMPAALIVYVVHQVHPGTDEYDEDKAFLGFPTLNAAVDAYLAHRDDGLAAFGGVTVLPLDDFRARVLATPDGDGSLTKSMITPASVSEAAAAGRYGNRPLGRTPGINVLEAPAPPRPNIHFVPPVAAYVAKLPAPQGATVQPKDKPGIKPIRRREIRIGTLKTLAATAEANLQTAGENRTRFVEEMLRRARALKNISPVPALSPRGPSSTT